MSSTLHPMLNVAVRAARAAGAIINRAALDVEAVRIAQKQANDFVTEVDQASEAAIIETLLTAYPGHGILAEESGRTQGDAHSDHIWIIDPLDGTTNFIHGFPVYCVSIALQVAGRIEQAVVYDPTRNDLFTATRGRGAFLNDRRIRVSKRAYLDDCLIATGFPFRPGDDYDAYLKMMGVMMRSTVGLRRPGSAALDLAYVAAGFSDGFFEAGLKPWDVAAGALLVTEAGGLVGNFAGDALQLDVPECLAANPRVYAQMVKLLARYSRAGERAGELPAAPAPSPKAAVSVETETGEPPAPEPELPVQTIAAPADELSASASTVPDEEPAQPATPAAPAEADLAEEAPAPSEPALAEPAPSELASPEPASFEPAQSEPAQLEPAAPADLSPVQRPRLRAAPRRAPEPEDAPEPRYDRARPYGRPGDKPAGKFGPRRDGDGPAWNDRPAPRPYGRPGAKPAGKFGPRRDGDGPAWGDRPAPRPYGRPGAKPAGKFGPRRDGDGPAWGDRPAPRPYGRPVDKPAGRFGPRRDDGGPGWNERPAFRDRPSRPAPPRSGFDGRRDNRDGDRAERYPASPRRTGGAPRGKPYTPRGPRSGS